MGYSVVYECRRVRQPNQNPSAIATVERQRDRADGAGKPGDVDRQSDSVDVDHRAPAAEPAEHGYLRALAGGLHPDLRGDRQRALDAQPLLRSDHRGYPDDSADGALAERLE